MKKCGHKACKIYLPSQILDCQEGKCINCAVDDFAHGFKTNITSCDKCHTGKILKNDCETPINRNCQRCHKKLVPIGGARDNGSSSHDDWSTRKYHKKCWKEMKKEEEDEYSI